LIALYRRFTSLDRPDRRLVLEAASLMALVWMDLIRFGGQLGCAVFVVRSSFFFSYSKKK
jgi:hypothetical protein